MRDNPGAAGADFRAAVSRFIGKRICQLEEEIARLWGPKRKPQWVKPNAPRKEKGALQGRNPIDACQDIITRHNTNALNQPA